MNGILSDAELKTLTRIKIGIIKTKTNIEWLNKLALESGLNLRLIDLSDVNIMEYGLSELVRRHEKAEDEIKKSAMAMLDKNMASGVSNFDKQSDNRTGTENRAANRRGGQNDRPAENK